MKKNISLLFFAFSFFCAKSQVLQWAAGFGSINTEVSNGVATDASGNVYSIGSFAGSTGFLTGTVSASMNSYGGSDAYIFKQDASGIGVWATKIGGTGNDEGISISTDPTGNIWVTGYFTGTVNFGTVPGNTLVSAGSNDVFIAKLNSSGTFLWAGRIGNSSTDICRSIDCDANGDVYLAGNFQNSIDLDPGAAAANYTAVGLNDSYVLKLSSTGSYIWAAFPGATSVNEIAYSVTADLSNAVYFSGNVTSPSNKVMAAKLNPTTGAILWSVVTDIIGFGFDIAVDPSGFAYLTGAFSGTYDFDYGPGTFTLASVAEDAFVMKINTTTNNFVWARAFGGSQTDYAQTIAVDGSGNIFTAGYFESTVDFDPGPGTFTLTSDAGSVDIYMSKLDAAGNFIWAVRMGGPNSDNCTSIITDASNNLISTGNFRGTVDFDPTSATYTLTCNTNGNGYTHKMACAPATPVSIIGNTMVCSGTTFNYSVAPVNGATFYSWSLPAGWSGSTGTNTIFASPNSSGTMSVTTSNSCGTSAPQTLSITVSPCTGETEINLNNKNILIYPNPFHEKITITSDFTLENIFVFNILGDLILTKEIKSQKAEIDLSKEASGIYFIRVGSVTQKIIKE